jgi:hypothetical protein
MKVHRDAGRTRSPSSVGGDDAEGVVANNPPLSFGRAGVALSRCVATTGVLLSKRAITQPKDHLDDVIHFADGSAARIYRETVVRNAPDGAPAVLVVGFRLRWVRGWGHRLFRAESLLNTPLFVGFPGFVSKLWLAHDGNGLYRGVYEWNEGRLADLYVRALWWVLAIVSERDSIRYVVVPGRRRDEVLTDPTLLASVAPDEEGSWWRLISIEPRTGQKDLPATREPRAESAHP